MICDTVGLAVQIFPATTQTFTMDMALSEQGRGTAWHVWINKRQGRGSAWAQHATRESTLRLPPLRKECLQINLCQAVSCLYPCTYVTLCCPYPRTDDTALRKNLTDALYMLPPLCSYHYIPSVSPQGTNLREYWYILRAGSTKCIITPWGRPLEVWSVWKCIVWIKWCNIYSALVGFLSKNIYSCLKCITSSEILSTSVI